MRLFGSLLVPIALNLHATRHSSRVVVGRTGSWPRWLLVTRRATTSVTTTLLPESSNDNNDHHYHHQLDDSPCNKSMIIHCNHAGASPSPESVLSTVWDHMQLEQSVGGYTAAEMAEKTLQSVYDRVAQLLGVQQSSTNNNNSESSSSSNGRHEIALVESATVAWTRLFYSMAHFQHQKRQDQIQQQQQQQQRQQQQQIGRAHSELITGTPAIAHILFFV